MSSTYTSHRFEGTTLVARVLREKISDPESVPLRTELLEAVKLGAGRLAIDLSEVHLLTSAGIGLLVTIHKACAESKGRMVIFGLSDDILGVMKITRIDKVFRIVPDEKTALGLLGG